MYISSIGSLIKKRIRGSHTLTLYDNKLLLLLVGKKRKQHSFTKAVVVEEEVDIRGSGAFFGFFFFSGFVHRFISLTPRIDFIYRQEGI